MMSWTNLRSDRRGAYRSGRSRLSAWEVAPGAAVVYDTQLGDANGAGPTALGGGSITINRTGWSSGLR